MANHPRNLGKTLGMPQQTVHRWLAQVGNGTRAKVGNGTKLPRMTDIAVPTIDITQTIPAYPGKTRGIGLSSDDYYG